MSKTLLVMAGGTGGHVFPALAVADYLKQQGVEICWLGTRRGLESKVIPEAGYPIEWVNISGLRGNGVLGWLQAPWRISKAVLEILRIMRRRKPDAVLGMGGFVTGPGGLAARLTGRPLLVHEQNSIPGMTNRWLSKFAVRVMEAFPGSFPADRHAVALGNPLRSNVLDSEPPEKRFAHRDGSIRVLVIGGSLGAKALNDVMPEVVLEMKKIMDVDVWHQTGTRNFDDTVARYQQKRASANVVPFIDNMAEAYQWADLVICRSGALTVSEICAVGVAAIFVPFPHAVDDHQTHNAEFLVKAGAARLVQQKNLTMASLMIEITACLEDDRKSLLDMAMRARENAKPQATEAVGQICLEVLGV